MQTVGISTIFTARTAWLRSGRTTNVIASLLSEAEAGTDSPHSPAFSEYERECQQREKQEAAIEQWARTVDIQTERDASHLPDGGG